MHLNRDIPTIKLQPKVDYSTTVERLKTLSVKKKMGAWIPRALKSFQKAKREVCKSNFHQNED